MTGQKLEKLNIFFILFFGVSLFVFLLLNGGAFWANIRYSLFLSSPLASADLRQGEILGESNNSSTVAVQPTDAKSLELHIPKLDVVVPVVLPEDTSKSGVLASLESGVGLYPSSVAPGANGRSVILGHSSKASWYRGKYAYVFATLNKLKPGDEFFITSNGKKYIYRVFENKILTPTETNILLAESVKYGSEVDLVTCYPVGSASKRTVIQASLVSIETI